MRSRLGTEVLGIRGSEFTQILRDIRTKDNTSV